MEPDTKHLRIPKIAQGIVIDHIPAGLGLKVASLLGLGGEEGGPLASIGLNFESNKLGLKDIIKVEARELDRGELGKLALICPGASVKRVVNYEIVERIVILAPEIMEGLIRCPNHNCVTNFERELTTHFTRISADPLVVRCRHCERTFRGNELRLQ